MAESHDREPNGEPTSKESSSKDSSKVKDLPEWEMIDLEVRIPEHKRRYPGWPY